MVRDISNFRLVIVLDVLFNRSGATPIACIEGDQPGEQQARDCFHINYLVDHLYVLSRCAEEHIKYKFCCRQ
jgi:hypothetical protein